MTQMIFINYPHKRAFLSGRQIEAKDLHISHNTESDIQLNEWEEHWSFGNKK